MRLRELLAVAEIEEARGKLDQPVTGLAYDSRQVKEGSVFFAVPGSHVDGHAFAGEALDRGAAAVVLEREIALPDHATWVRVRNVRRAMGQWSAMFFGYPGRRMVLLGVTGTNGKTTVTYLLESIFAAAGMVSGVIGTVNYRYRGRTIRAPQTTPESIDLEALLAEMAESGVQSAAMEVSSHALALERVRGIDFDGALFTNLSRDHLDFHPDMDHYFSSKASLFTDYLRSSIKHRKFAVIHGEDGRGAELLSKVRQTGLEVLSYGRGTSWDVHPLDVEGDLGGLRGKISVQGQVIEFSSRLIGRANLENILGAVGASFSLGLPPRAVADGIKRLKMVPGRLEGVENSLGITVLVDYAHTPDALEKVLEILGPLSHGRLICVFGCGGDRDRGKRPLMGGIAARLGDLVVLTSDNPRTEDPVKIIEEIEEGVRKTALTKFSILDFGFPITDLKSKIANLKSEKGYFVEPNRRAAIRLALQLARAGDLVLLAGKGHEGYQIIGSQRLQFDDREVAREELGKISY